jgi:hypothetical protein
MRHGYVCRIRQELLGQLPVPAPSPGAEADSNATIASSGINDTSNTTGGATPTPVQISFECLEALAPASALSATATPLLPAGAPLPGFADPIPTALAAPVPAPAHPAHPQYPSKPKPKRPASSLLTDTDCIADGSASSDHSRSSTSSHDGCGGVDEQTQAPATARPRIRAAQVDNLPPLVPVPASAHADVPVSGTMPPSPPLLTPLTPSAGADDMTMTAEERDELDQALALSLALSR